MTQTGTLTLGQAVFLPTAARVTSVAATLGAPVQAGQPVLSATSTTRQVSIALDAVPAVRGGGRGQGDHHLAEQPDHAGGDLLGGHGRRRPSGSGSADSSPTITVLVNPTDPAATGTVDQAPVNVTITTGSVSNVLVVPVDALLAQSGGGYAVEVAAANGVHAPGAGHPGPLRRRRRAWCR